MYDHLKLKSVARLLCVLTERELLGWISLYFQEISFLSVSTQMLHILDWDILSPWEQAMSLQRLCLILMDTNGGLPPWKHWSKVIRKSWISTLQLMTAFGQKWHICSLYMSAGFDERHADLFILALHQFISHADTNTLNHRHVAELA